mgnify:CR=1 FL=1
MFTVGGAVVTANLTSPEHDTARNGAEKLRVLVACEYSAIVRDAFCARGFDAWSCDLLPTEGDPRWHIQGDAIEVAYGQHWDLMVAHPPCQFLSRAGARWWRCPQRQLKANAAADFVFALRDAPILHIAIENPRGQLNKRWRYPDQTIQPWEYGHPFSKATCFWLKNLPPLMPTDIVADYEPFLPSNTGAGRKKGQRNSPGSAQSPHERSRTFAGVAQAMADQWGDHIINSRASLPEPARGKEGASTPSEALSTPVSNILSHEAQHV